MKSKKIQFCGLVFLAILFVICLAFLIFGYNQSETFAVDYEYETNLVLTKYKIKGYNSSVKVVNPNGKIVQTEDDGSFMLLCTGEYRIERPEGTTIVRSLLNVVPCELSLTGTLKDKYPEGSIVDLPSLVIKNEYYSFASYYIEIIKDNKYIKTIEVVVDGQPVYVFAENGHYILKYYVINAIGEKEEISVNTFIENQKSIFCENLPERIFLGNSLSIGYPYAYYSGQSYDVLATAIRPDGKKELIKTTEYTPEMTGKYKIKFLTLIEGSLLSKDYIVNVERPKTGIINVSGESENSGITDLPSYSEKQGRGLLIRSFSRNTKFYYGGIVNLSSLTKEDNLIEFLAYSEGDEVYEGGIKVTFTDIYDENKFFTLKFYLGSYTDVSSYCTVVYDNAEYGISNEQANYGKLRAGYGITAYDTSFKGDGAEVREKKDGKTKLFNVQFDATSNILYMFTRGYDENGVSGYSQKKFLPLSDTSVLAEEYIFNGFTSGETYVTFEIFDNNNAGIYITELAGIKAENLDTKQLGDNLIVFDEYSSEIFDGAVNYYYPIPYAHASMLYSGTNKVNVSVTGPDGNMVKVENNAFIPTVAGIYKIIYSIELSGERVEKILCVNVYETPHEIKINGDFDVDVAYGDFLEIPDFMISGGNGKVETKISVYSDDKEILPHQNGKYLVVSEKPLKVKIYAIDQIENDKIKEFFLNVSAGGRFVATDSLPKSIKAGETLYLPEITGYYYDGTTMKMGNASVFVSKVINGENTEYYPVMSSQYIIPNDCSAIYLKYYFEGVDEIHYLYIIPEVISGSTDYLDIKGAEGVFFTEAGIVLYGNDDMSFSMPYRVSAEELAVCFVIHPQFSDIDYINIFLRNADDSNLIIKLTFKDFNNETGSIALYINDNYSKTYYLKGKMYRYSSTCASAEYVGEYKNKTYYLFSFLFSADNHKIYNGNNLLTVATIHNYYDGAEFDGFGDKSCYIDFALKNTSGNKADFVFQQIGNVYYNYYTESVGFNDYDIFEPEIIIYETDISRNFSINDSYEIPYSKAYDVLSGECKVTVTVYDPDENIILNVLASDKSTVVLNKYGSYYVVYESKDKSLNQTFKRLKLTVVDDVLPQLNVNGTYLEKYKVGEQINVADYVAYDEQGDVETIIMLKDDCNKISIIKAGSTFVLDKAGSYELIYRSVDRFFNTTRKVFKIEAVR